MRHLSVITSSKDLTGNINDAFPRLHSFSLTSTNFWPNLTFSGRLDAVTLSTFAEAVNDTAVGFVGASICGLAEIDVLKLFVTDIERNATYNDILPSCLIDSTKINELQVLRGPRISVSVLTRMKALRKLRLGISDDQVYELSQFALVS